ncbi:cation-transporting P-type ATPase [Massilia brevitalea]|uniref:cation-transporting P-type ATPase n=1 Tax=Massilia brevitalea TaxID=442526 RepID=UPI00351CF622
MNAEQIRALAGLSDAEAASRLADDGPNALPDNRRRGWAAIAPRRRASRRSCGWPALPCSC